MDSRPTRVPSPALNNSVTDASRTSDTTLHCQVSAHAHKFRKQFGSLVDRGANGCIIGSDMRKISTHGSFTHLNGIDDHAVRDLALVTAGAYARTQLGPIILN